MHSKNPCLAQKTDAIVPRSSRAACSRQDRQQDEKRRDRGAMNPINGKTWINNEFRGSRIGMPTWRPTAGSRGWIPHGGFDAAPPLVAQSRAAPRA